MISPEIRNVITVKEFEAPAGVSSSLGNNRIQTQEQSENTIWSPEILGIQQPNVKIVGMGEIGTWKGKKPKINGKTPKRKKVYTCGETDVPVLMCKNPECRKVYYSSVKCHLKSCPNCYKEWIRTSKDKIIARLLSKTALALSKAGNKSGWNIRLVPIIVSKKDWAPVSKMDMDKERDEAIKWLKERGAIGGVCIPHPFRTTQEAKDLAKEAKKAKWDWIREQISEWRYYNNSYHLHLECYVGYMKQPEEGEAFIYKMQTDVNGNVIDFLRMSKRKKEMGKHLSYVLGHSGYLVDRPGGMDSYIWFGTCTKKSFKISEEEEELSKKKLKPKPCRICGGELGGYYEGLISYLYEIGAGLDPPKFESEIDSLLGGYIPDDSKIFHAEYESEEEEEWK